MAKQVGFIDGLRAIAAFWVMSAHCWIWGGGFSTLNPKFAVDLFMMISGFLMALHVEAREQREPLSHFSTWIKFYIRRFFRIAPVYYLCIATVVATAGSFLSGYAILRSFNPSFWAMSGCANNPACVHYTWSNVLAHVTFVFGAIPSYSSSTMLPDWSIGLEMQFYLIFPALYLAMRRWGHARVGLAAVALTMTAWVALHLAWFRHMPVYSPFPEPSFIIFKLQYFVIGSLIYNSTLSSHAKAVPWGTVAICCALSLIEVPTYRASVAIELVIVLLFFLLALNADTAQTRIKALMAPLQGRVARFGADTSYSVYLFHGLFISLAAHMLSPSIDPVRRVLFIWAFVTVCVYACGAALHVFVETPGIALGARILRFGAAKQSPIQPRVPSIGRAGE